MARTASKDTVSLTREQLQIASRSEHQATYLTPSQLALAPELMLAEICKAKSRHPSGEAIEEFLADLLGGQLNPHKKNRGVADIFVNGVGFSVKTRALPPAACRPRFTDWLLHEISLKAHWLQPLDNFPRGQNVLNASATVVGRRLCPVYNEQRESFDVKHKWVVIRLQDDVEQVHRFLVWREEIPPLDPADYKWTTTSRSTVAHSIKAERRDNPGTTELTWSSSGCSLFLRHVIPADADTFVVPYSKVKSRKETNCLILAASYGG